MQHPSAQKCAEAAARIHEIIVARVGDLPDMKGRRKSYFCVSWLGLPTAGGLVGELDDSLGVGNQLEKYDRLSREKPGRVNWYYGKCGHRLSRQSANPKEDEFPGGVHGEGGYGAAFSGYPGDVDEIGAALLLIDIGAMDRTDANGLLQTNPYFQYFSDLFEPVKVEELMDTIPKPGRI